MLQSIVLQVYKILLLQNVHVIHPTLLSTIYWLNLQNQQYYLFSTIIQQLVLLLIIFINKIIRMQLGNNKLTIVGSRGTWLSLSQAKTYRNYLGKQIQPSSQIQEQLYIDLLSKGYSEIIETIHYKKTQGNNILVIISPYESTLMDLLNNAGSFREGDLYNTLQEILKLLQRLHKKGQQYGMLSAETICFCNGSLKFIVGPQTPRNKHESALQADLLTLGNLILELAVGPKASKTAVRRARMRYSQSFCTIISLLLDQDPQKRLKVFDLMCQNPEDQQIRSNVVQEKNQVGKLALTEINHSKQGDSTSQFFKKSLGKVEDAVKRGIDNSRRIMQKNQNNPKKLVQ